MAVHRFDHFILRTRWLPDTLALHRDIVGLAPGPGPVSGFQERLP